MLFFLTTIVLVASVFLGGGTRVGFGGDVIVQLLAVPLLLTALWILLERSRNPEKKISSLGLPVTLILIAVMVLVMHLLPMPTLKLVDGEALGLFTEPVLLVDGNSWNSMSLSPHLTWASVASLIVPSAVFLGVAMLDTVARLALYKIIIILGAISLLIGFLQIAQGPQSSLRFFDFTNTSEAVGFFANRNHFAALMYVTLTLMSVWFVTSIQASFGDGATKSSVILKFFVALALLIALLAGLAVARSRAAVILAIVALVAILFLISVTVRQSSDGVKRNNSKINRIWIFSAGFGVFFAVQFGLGRLLTRFDRDPLEDLRVPLASTTWETSFLFPFGAGAGSFVNVYAAMEKTGDIFSGYANRAHNDFLEVMLETGLAAVLMLAIFSFWFLRRACSVWSNAQLSLRDVDEYTLLQRASTIVIMLLFLHSLVDYPLRTTALATIFSICCANLLRFPAVQPSGPSHVKAASDSSVEPGVVRKRSAKQVPWRGDVDLPESWRSK